MNKCYFINKSAIFFPSKRIIVSSTSGHKVKINNPTAQLLEAFIKNMGVIISQSELYTIAWGEDGVKVTPNALYQNICLLRKALQESGVMDEVITTVRGKGFLFSAHHISEKELINGKGKITKKITLIISFFLLFLVISLYSYLYFARAVEPVLISENNNFKLFPYVSDCWFFVKSKEGIFWDESKTKEVIQGDLSNCDSYPYVY